MTQRRPDGPFWPTSDAWKGAVEAELATRHWSRADLARVISRLDDEVERMSISNLLGPDSIQSRLVPRVHEALGWPPPPAPEEAAALAREIREYVGDLTDEQRAAVHAVAEAFRKGRP